jgi:hypothetical protein
MGFMAPKVNSTKKKSGKLVGYAPEIPDMGHGGHKLTGNPSAKMVNGSIKKPNK